MPLRMRIVLYLSTFLLFYHWVFGLPTFLVPGLSPSRQQILQDSPPTLDLSWKKRIVAVGDLHGDLSHALRVFRAASIVDHRGFWIGNDTTLVQTGDIVDRGKDTIALYRLMDTLRAQAARDGGQVISLLGNHEFMNVMGDWRYVTKEDIATFHGEQNRHKAFSTGWIGQTFLANYSVAARVPYYSDLGSTELTESTGSSALLAVHGGIHPSWADVDRINRVGKSLIDKLVNAKNPTSMGLPRDVTPEERDLYSATGPLWYRGYALDDEDTDGICEQADEVLTATKSTRMIMGHTPHFSGIVSRCRSKVIIIDTGISRAYGGVLSALEIVYSLTPIPSSRGSEAQSDPHKAVELEVVTAIYEGRKDVISKREKVVPL